MTITFYKIFSKRLIREVSLLKYDRDKWSSAAVSS